MILIQVLLVFIKMSAYTLIGVYVIANFVLGNAIENWEEEGYEIIKQLAICTSVAAFAEVLSGPINIYYIFNSDKPNETSKK